MYYNLDFYKGRPHKLQLVLFIRVIFMIFIMVGPTKVCRETSTIIRVIFMIFIRVGPTKVCSETSTTTCSLL